jgi:FkbM family methyltransferase
MFPILAALAESGFQPKSILDVGACRGTFTAKCRDFWPDTQFCMVEANRDRIDDLSLFGEYHIALLGRESGKMVKFYRSKSEYYTGDSMYREMTPYYDDQNVIVEEYITTRLDDLLPGRRFDFAKLDVQGAELDVIKGGRDVLSQCKCILMEVQSIQYNAGAPLVDEVVAYMLSIEYEHAIVLSATHAGPNGIGPAGPDELIYQDIMFLKNREYKP